jgi:ubiquinone/menaquinone biosynthesis C-methylase UbiE
MSETATATGVKIHLGCGERYFPGWVHVDVRLFEHVDHVCDIRSLPFPDGHADLLYACQVLEYFDREEAVDVLTEWKRVLRPGGVLRLSVPDFAVLVKLYGLGLPIKWILGTLFGRIAGPEPGSHLYHHTTYDEPSARQLLEQVGFCRVRLWDWRTTEHAAIDDFSQAYFPHMRKDDGILMNLNIEAEVP